MVKLRKRTGYINVTILFMVSVFGLVLILTVFPIFNKKLNLDNFANEILRVAEIEGYVGSKTNDRINELKEITGLDPEIVWDKTGNIQIGEGLEVIVKDTYDISFFIFDIDPIDLVSKATGKSEVYWK